MDKETIIKGLKYWIEKHKDENLLLSFQAVKELYEVLIEDNIVPIAYTTNGMFYEDRDDSTKWKEVWIK